MDSPQASRGRAALACCIAACLLGAGGSGPAVAQTPAPPPPPDDAEGSEPPPPSDKGPISYRCREASRIGCFSSWPVVSIPERSEEGVMRAWSGGHLEETTLLDGRLDLRRAEGISASTANGRRARTGTYWEVSDLRLLSVERTPLIEVDAHSGRYDEQFPTLPDFERPFFLVGPRFLKRHPEYEGDMELTVTLHPPEGQPMTATFRHDGPADLVEVSTYRGTVLADAFEQMRPELDRLRDGDGPLPGLQLTLGLGSGAARDETLAQSELYVVSASVLEGSLREETVLIPVGSKADSWRGAATTSAGYYRTPLTSDIDSQAFSAGPNPTDPPGLTGPERDLFESDRDSPQTEPEADPDLPPEDSVAAVNRLLPGTGEVAGASVTADAGSPGSPDESRAPNDSRRLEDEPPDVTRAGVAPAAPAGGSDSDFPLVAVVALAALALVPFALPGPRRRVFAVLRRLGQR